MSHLLCLAVTTLLVTAAPAPKTLTLTVSAGTEDRPAGPAMVPVTLPEGLADVALVRDAGGKTVTAQLTAPGLLDTTPAPAGKVRRELHLLLPALKAGETFDVRVDVGREPPGLVPGFVCREAPGKNAELLLRGQPVLRYECERLDDSTKARREATFKVYHHLFADDGTLATKGLGGLYPHHRGLFYGFRKTTYGGGKEVDTWHCTGDTAQVHEKTVSAEGGPLLGRHRVVIAWLGKGKEPFAREERELTVWDVPGGRLVEFASVLRPVSGTVKLDGDPQHAGFHFSAGNDVAERTKGQTYYVRPDGPGKPGATRNWPQDKGHVDLPWDAMSFVLGGQRYTAAYLDRPENPKEARFSERDYGRFGSYFVAEATPEKPVAVRYRVWLQRGAMEGKDVAALDAAFVKPVGVAVKD